jgi:ketosteroid isomerase-like protein
MSEENVEIVRSFTEAYLRGDHARAVSYLAPDVVYEVGQELPARRPDELLAMWKRWEADWERIELTPEEYIDAGDQVVLAVRYSGRARASGIELEDRLFEVHTLRDSKIARKREFKTRSEALEAAGLSE